MGTSVSGFGNATLQEALGALLEKDERTLAWLARKVGVSVSHLYRVSIGERPITRPLADKISVVLGVPVSTFLPETDE